MKNIIIISKKLQKTQVTKKQSYELLETKSKTRYKAISQPHILILFCNQGKSSFGREKSLKNDEMGKE